MSVLDHFFGVSNKVVLITGGGRGIGEFIAEGFVKAGAKVYICSRKPDTCTETAAKLSKYGACIALPVEADISTAQGRAAVVEAMRSREQKLDILINNAGALWAAPLAEYPESGWDKVFDLNVKGQFFLIRDLVPMLEKAATKKAPARVINIGSIDAFHIPKHETYAYSSSKAALHQLSIHLADQLAARHITVNVIAPGMFPSKMMRQTIDRVGEDKMSEKVPLRRLTQGEDVAGTAIFLASHAASYITGAVLPVDGGTATTL
jgi:NAD(P)-dependent dehydrogenase (short-subunit alcohol dehydrogenase family)